MPTGSYAAACPKPWPAPSRAAGAASSTPTYRTSSTGTCGSSPRSNAISQLTALVRLLAARSGHLVAAGSLESDLQISRPTVARYMRLLEEVFLIKRIPGWSRSLGTRVTSASKLIFVDSGIASRLLALDAHTLRRPGSPFGPLIEGFVLSELARQLTWSHELADLYHYRDHNKVEVDAILENRQRQVIGIEIKASSTVRTDDFNGLRRLAEKLGDDFLVGLVLYSGRHYTAVRLQIQGNTHKRNLAAPQPINPIEPESNRSQPDKWRHPTGQTARPDHWLKLHKCSPELFSWASGRPAAPASAPAAAG